MEKNRSLSINLIESKRASRLRTEHAFRPSSRVAAPPGLGRQDLCYKTVGRYREKSSTVFLLDPRIVSAGNSVQSSVNLLRLKPALVRALVSLLWIKCQTIHLNLSVFEPPNELVYNFHSLSHLHRPTACQPLCFYGRWALHAW